MFLQERKIEEEEQEEKIARLKYEWKKEEKKSLFYSLSSLLYA